ncbi:MAG: hypothetical protein ACJA0Q_002156 [Saprospiraceae bacterium]|jgi:hypothetical protein
MKAIFPLTYLGPISYYANMLQFDEVLIEKNEHFIKQSYRNRCDIIGATGSLSLSVPTFRKGRDKTIIDKVGISNDSKWQTLHWRSISTAYRSSPYFEYYEEDFENFFLEAKTNLFNFNLELTKVILKRLGIDVKFTMTSEFILHHDIPDFRPNYSRKFPDNNVYPRYIQVFEDRVGFHKNLTILDLLFNQGPSSIEYLKIVELNPIAV